MNNTCDTLIKNARIVNPGEPIKSCDIMIENGKIKSISNSLGNFNSSVEINANDNFVLPGPIDPHVHYGVFEPVPQAAISESRSAAIGGITTIIRMLRLNGNYSKIKEHIRCSNESHYVDFSIHASITNRNQVSNIKDLQKIGINSFKIYMNLGSGLNHILMDSDPETLGLVDKEVNVTDELIKDIIKETSQFRSTTLIHAEDHKICSKQTSYLTTQTNSENNPLKLWSESRPEHSEEESIRRISRFFQQSNEKMYFVHIGSKTALQTIIQEKKKYSPGKIFAETCPHYLTHTFDFNKIEGKVSPPLRSKEDMEYIWKGVSDGSIDTIGTDHVANRLSLKKGKDIWSSLAGFPGLATMIPVLLSEGVNKNRISLSRLVELTSYNTSRIFDIYPRKGFLQKGSDADLIIIDLKLEKKVHPEILQSFSDYSIYEGWKLTGWPILTMVRGEIIMRDGIICNNKLGHGQFVARPASLKQES